MEAERPSGAAAPADAAAPIETTGLSAVETLFIPRPVPETERPIVGAGLGGVLLLVAVLVGASFATLNVGATWAQWTQDGGLWPFFVPFMLTKLVFEFALAFGGTLLVFGAILLGVWGVRRHGLRKRLLLR